MKFGRKSKGSDTSGGSVAVAPSSSGRRPEGIEMGQNTGADGLPGRAGYPSGPRTALPTFFTMRRPDGRADPPPPKKKRFG